MPRRRDACNDGAISNIVLNPHVGLLFVLPGRDETLRVNGRAELLTCHIELGTTPDELAADLELGDARDLAAERAPEQ